MLSRVLSWAAIVGDDITRIPEGGDAVASRAVVPALLLPELELSMDTTGPNE